MQVDNRLLDDLARLTSGALGSLAGLKEEIDALVRRRLERLLAEMELVRREEFEADRAVPASIHPLPCNQLFRPRAARIRPCARGRRERSLSCCSSGKSR